LRVPRLHEGPIGPSGAVEAGVCRFCSRDLSSDSNADRSYPDGRSGDAKGDHLRGSNHFMKRGRRCDRISAQCNAGRWHGQARQQEAGQRARERSAFAGNCYRWRYSRRGRGIRHMAKKGEHQAQEYERRATLLTARSKRSRTVRAAYTLGVIAPPAKSSRACSDPDRAWPLRSVAQGSYHVRRSGIWTSRSTSEEHSGTASLHDFRKRHAPECREVCSRV